MQSPNPTTPEEMVTYWAQQWQSAGIEAGDTLLVHSSASRTIKNAKVLVPDITPTHLMQSFLSAVGKNGTVLFPLFNFDWPKGTAFDIRNTPSQMGAMTEAARLYPNSVRTGHPIYSFAVIGYRQNEFADICNKSGYDAESPFAQLHKLDGKIGILDLADQDSMTFYHHVEEMNQVDYRYFKNWTNLYTDINGKTAERTFSLFVRNIEQGVCTDVNRMMENLWEKNLYKGNRPGVGHGFRSISARKLYKETEMVIQSGQALDFLISIKKQNEQS